MSISDMQQCYGESFMEVCERLHRIVDATRGIYLSYDDQPVLGAFCAMSGGKTRNGNEIFGRGEYTYLESVDCPYDLNRENYGEDYYFTWKELEQKFGVSMEESGQKIEITKKDDAGYALKVTLGDQDVTGEEFRNSLHINSSHMEITALKAGVRIQTKGIGHGFGMSQYMAQSLAEKGSDYIEILSYFFPNAEIEKQ